MTRAEVAAVTSRPCEVTSLARERLPFRNPERLAIDPSAEAERVGNRLGILAAIEAPLKQPRYRLWLERRRIGRVELVRFPVGHDCAQDVVTLGAS